MEAYRTDCWYYRPSRGVHLSLANPAGQAPELPACRLGHLEGRRRGSRRAGCADCPDYAPVGDKAVVA